MCIISDRLMCQKAILKKIYTSSTFWSSKMRQTPSTNFCGTRLRHSNDYLSTTFWLVRKFWVIVMSEICTGPWSRKYVTTLSILELIIELTSRILHQPELATVNSLLVMGNSVVEGSLLQLLGIMVYTFSLYAVERRPICTKCCSQIELYFPWGWNRRFQLSWTG